MKLSNETLQKISSKSRSFYDKIENCNNTKQTHDDLSKNRFFQQWQKTVANNDPDTLIKRFSWDGFSLKQVNAALTTATSQTYNDNIHPWMKLLQNGVQIAELFATENTKYKYPWIKKKSPLPFEDILLPFVQIASDRLYKEAPEQMKLLHKRAAHKLIRSLLNKLCFISVFALHKEFLVFRYINWSRDPFTSLLEKKCTNKQYHEFVNTMLTNQLTSFLEDYAVLAKLIGTTTTFWLDNIKEFLQRVEKDKRELIKVFGINKNSFKIKNIKTDISDAHNKGKKIIIVEFACGTKVVYKPRNLGIDAAYFDFLKWINQQEKFMQSFKTLKIINKSDYGWVEFVEYLECKNTKGIKDYYNRVGKLICVLYLLEGTDFHFENIIANASFPVIVDLETLLQPTVKPFDASSTSTSQTIVDKSVLRLGLLPFGNNNFEKYGLDVSGLAGDILFNTTIKNYRWTRINCDDMSYKYITINKSHVLQSNFPKLAKQIQTPQNYITQIINGFTTMYDFFLKNKKLLLSANSPFKLFLNQEIRWVVRSTKIYALLLQFSQQAEFLQNGIKRNIALDILTKPLLYNNKKPLVWQLILPEHKAMDILDIPKFTFSTSNKKPDFFTRLGYNNVTNKIQHLSKEDLDFQSKLIKYSLCARYAKELSTQQPKKSSSLPKIFGTKKASDIIKNEVLKITEIITMHAIYHDNSATWLQIDFDPMREDYYLQQADFNLYNGATGIALFLAAASKIFCNDNYRKLALAGLQPLRTFLKTDEFKFLGSTWGIGGTTGLGSIIYALVCINNLIKEPSLLEDAKIVASLINDDLINKDQILDIIAGSAGAILSLLNLYKITSEQKFLQKAIACGEHLLKNKITKNGHKTWITINSHRPLAGFGHGAAGIAYALLKLFEATQKNEYLQAAKEGIMYETSIFHHDANNWPDLRTSCKTPQYQNAWCHGAVGIGLGRLGGLPIYDTISIRKDIDHALNATLQHNNRILDHLCCGNFGRINFISEATHRLGIDDLHNEATRYALSIITKAKHKGGFSFIHNFPTDTPILGLFRGITGVGYELLRMTSPDNLPSILLFE
ncbi:MAG: type 2 lanthipeptide synthetase LanM family protein [Gammaproteobacteria bacterium]|jgi:type 2 lantibiotic biosynthesis protein LanM